MVGRGRSVAGNRGLIFAESLVSVLAARRLTQLVVEDEITRPLRDAVGRWGDRHPEGSLPDRLAYLVSCSACTSVWAAAGVLAAARFRAGRAAAQVLALSAAALAAQAVVDRLER